MENLQPSSEQEEIVSAQEVDQRELEEIPRVVTCKDKDNLGSSIKFEKRGGGKSPGDKVQKSESEVAKVHNANSSESVKLVILVAQPILAQNNIASRVNLQCVSGVQNQAAVGKSVDVPLKRIVSDQTRGEQNYVASREKLQYWYTVQNRLVASESDDIPPNTAREQAIGKEEDPGKMPPHADDLQVQSSADKCSTRENQNKHHHSPDDESQSQVCGDTAPSEANVSCLSMDPPSNVGKSSAQPHNVEAAINHTMPNPVTLITEGGSQEALEINPIPMQNPESQTIRSRVEHLSQSPVVGLGSNNGKSENVLESQPGAINSESHGQDESKEFLCAECGKSFPTEGRLHQHATFHIHVDSNDGKLACRICGLKLKNNRVLKQHEIAHDPNAFKCLICGRYFRQKPHAIFHLRRDHKLNIGEKWGKSPNLDGLIAQNVHPNPAHKNCTPNLVIGSVFENQARVIPQREGRTVQEEEEDTEMLHVVEIKEEMLDDGFNQQESGGGQIQWQSFEATFQDEDVY